MEQGYRSRRFETPSADLKYISGYPIEGAELQDLVQSQPEVVFSQVIDLSTATPVNAPIEITAPGRAVVIHGFLTTNKYDPVANTGTEPAEISAFVVARVNSNQDQNAVILRHNRGFRGTFNKLFLSFPAQAGISVRVTVLKYDATPWLEDSDLGNSGRKEGSKITTQAVFTAGVVSAQLIAQKLTRKVATITCLGPGNIFLGDSTVTTGSGAFPGTQVLANGIAYYRNTASLFVVASQANTLVAVNEEE